MALARVNVSSGGRTPPVIVNVPTQSGTLTYSGSVKTPTWNGYDATQLLIGGTTSATNAGTYTATFTPQGNVTWSDGTSSPKSVTWTIAKATPVLTLSKTSGQVNKDETVTFTATSPSDGALSVTSSNSNVATATVSGTTITVTGRGSGDATITVSQAATTNYEAKTANYFVAVAKATPTLTLSETSGTGTAGNSSANYGKVTFTVTSNSTGTITVSSSAPSIANPNKSGNTVTVTCYKPGTATITVSQAATTDYAAASATYTVTVIKATPTLNLSASSDTIEVGKTLTIAANHTAYAGTISATSSNTSVATVTTSGDNVTVTGVSIGDATITVSLSGSDVYEAVSKTYTVAITVPIITDDWATISSRAKAGTAANYYKVGDCKEITLNGKIGDYCELNNEKLYVFILHINYPMNGTPDNNIIWGGFKLADGKDVALSDSKITADLTDGTICFNVNHWGNANYGGWKGTDLRYDIFGATSTPPSDYGAPHTESCIGYNATAATLTSPKANTLLAALPSDFRNVLRLWSRWVDAKGNSSNVEANIEETVDAVTLLTEFEVQGARRYANQYEQNHQTQMDYYKSGNSKIRRRHNSTVSIERWRLASPGSGTAVSFCTVTHNGSPESNHASYPYMLAPAFKV